MNETFSVKCSLDCTNITLLHIRLFKTSITPTNHKDKSAAAVECQGRGEEWGVGAYSVNRAG